jgi:hypothetical protein
LATNQQPGPAKPHCKADRVRGFRPFSIDFLDDKSTVFELKVQYIVRSREWCVFFFLYGEGMREKEDLKGGNRVAIFVAIGGG